MGLYRSLAESLSGRERERPLGLQARSRLAGAKGASMASAAVVIGALGLLLVVFFLAVGAPD